jgi:beta-lactamase class D
MPTSHARLRLATSMGLLALLGLLGLLPACAPAGPGPRAPTRPASVTTADISRVFRAQGVTGCFVLHDVEHNTTVRYDATRARLRMLPASTFKIPNALIAVETGVIRTPHQRLRWNGKKYRFPPWNRDHTLRSAIRHSVVWAFQWIARQVGRARMQHWIDRLGYGNRDLSGPIDTFWLDGRLRISAEEQVAFLKRLQAGKLPFSARTQALVREALVVERAPTHVLRAKTGWAIRKQRQHGWYVGWVERGPRVWIFAMNMDGLFSKNRGARLTITRAVLRLAGALPAR